MPSIRAIASENGLHATRLAYRLIRDGADPLVAAVEGITLVEDDPCDLTVGYGGLPNENGIVELDAAVMHGPTLRAGAVAGVQRTRHVARLARTVLEQSKHVLLVGAGADEFARAHGFAEEDLLTETARKIWLYWKQTNSERDDWVAPSTQELDPAVIKFFRLEREQPASKAMEFQRTEAVERPTGTVHCSALNARGDVSCATSTSGLAFKIPGRVGDSAVIGAGLYAENGVGTCGSTGRGEENLRHASAFAVIELMRQGASPGEAARIVLERVVSHANLPWLQREDGRPNFGLKLYAMNCDGEYAGVSLWGPTDFAVTDDQGTRLEACEFLFRRS